MTDNGTGLVMYGEVEERYGTRKLVTEVATRKADDTLESTSLYWQADRTTHVAGLQITAYLSPDEGEAYGYRVGYRSLGGVTELGQMEDQVKVLRRIKRGMAEAESLFGGPRGYADYVCHVAHALRVTGFAYRRTRQEHDMCGSWVRYVDADGFHYWVRQMEVEFGRRPVAA